MNNNITILNLVLTQVQSIMRVKGISIKNQNDLFKLVPLVMEVVETIKREKKSGSSKKEIALEVIILLLQQAPINEIKRNLLFELIDNGSISTTIDLLVDASQGRLELNRKTRRKFLKCLGSCLTTTSRYDMD
jgi:Asp-tRNA(Asn)/Glu-tRNA(Gln) amidotransferase B subunit